MKTKIINILKEHTDIFGFVSTTRYIQERKKAYTRNTFKEYAFLNGYHTIITLGFPYPKQEVAWKGKEYGIFARFSYSNDYHTVIKIKLEQIITSFQNIGIKGLGSVDVSLVDEKYAAYLSGIGYYGKNAILINPDYGNYMFLATIIIDKAIEETFTIENECGDCTICIKACPSGALEDGFHKEKCISYLSQTKIPFNELEISYFKKMIYGCDICLRVCPKNTGIDVHRYPQFEPDGIENIHLGEILDMSNKSFKKVLGYNTSHWIGVSQMKRNALCLIANQKLVQYIPKIKETMSVYKDNLWYNKTAELVLKVLERE